MTEKHDTLPRVFVSIGSNIEPEKHLPEAVRLLREQCTVHRVSSVYQSPAFGHTEQPDFMDMVVEITTRTLPQIFKDNVLEKIEKKLGRDRASQENKYGPLTLDMDILLWGEAAFSYGKKPWRVPDKNILKYAAMAIPLAEIAPDFVHPTEKVTLKEIADRFDPNEIRLTDLKIE